MKVARLFDEIVPRRYTLDLIVRMEKAETMGREVVYFDLAAPTRTLVFHAAGLTILSGRLDGTTESAGIVVHPQDLTVAFTFETILPKGSHELDIQFKGSISNSMHGLYRSDYLDGSRKKWLATTQFEAVHAREAFVCIDEPAAKAVFEVSLTVPEAMAALSNANVSHEETSSEGYKKVQFAPTPVMSTYLLAFLVGEFEYVEDTASDGTLVRVYATPGKTSQLGFALDTTIRILPYFNDYFDTHYPLPKLDLIAVPDFSAGAMENWGAITFRETALLLDPDKTSLANKQRVAEVIAHELAHQWFGDLVTMSWWGDLWLNEGFASWIETLAIDEIWPEWHIWSMFLDSDVSRAQRLDSLENTHPIQVEVDDPRALDEIFDAISYSKGASILNMLHHYLGADVFRQGLRTYLRAHQFANATTEDLWRALEHASGKPVVAVMSAWTSHPGFPLLSLSDGHVSQRRFYRSRKTPDLAKKTAPEVWPVPFSVITDSQTETASALIKSSRSVLPDKLADSAWVKPNPGQTAFYRMHYTHDMIERLTEPLQKQTLGDRDRYGVVSDVFATTEAGITPTADALRLLETLRDEPDFVVWSGMRSGLVNIMAIVEQETLLGDLEAFGRWLVEPHVTRLGWERRPGEAAFDTLMRPMILQLAVRFDSPQVTTEATRYFTDFTHDRPLDPDLRAVALFAAARHGGEAEFTMMLKRYREESSPQVKIGLLGAMGSFRKIGLIKRYLDSGLSPDVRPQDIYIVLSQMFGNRSGRNQAWTWMKMHWDELTNRYGAGGHMLERFPLYVAHGFSTRAMAAEVSEFFSLHPHPATVRPTAQALEMIEAKADWFERDGDGIAEFLDAWKRTSGEGRRLKD